MGSANDWLVPPAILYNNPGITKEEFVDLLDKTKAGIGSLGDNFENWKKAPWDIDGKNFDYHKGLHGLAGILGMDYSDEFKAISWKDKDLEGFPLSPPYLEVNPFFSDFKWHLSYMVRVQIGNENPKQKEVKGWENKFVREGDILTDDYYFEFLVDQVLERNLLSREDRDGWGELRPFPRRVVKILGREVIPQVESHIFYSLPLLLEKHSYFDPNFMFDFSAEAGTFSSRPLTNAMNKRRGLNWEQRNGKYYLDMKKLPAISSFNPAQAGYMDWLLVGGFKVKAWKLSGISWV